MKITCEDWLGALLVKIGAATELKDVPKEEPKPVPTVPPRSEPAFTPWQSLIAAVKQSSMSEQMKIACVAQAIIESGRGTSRVSKELTNFWGIKFRETLDGLAEPARIEVTSETQGWDIFAKFPNADTAVKGWLKFLTREYYAGWEQYQNNAAEFIRHIGKAWCPAPGYAEKVIGCIDEARQLLQIKSDPVAGKLYRALSDAGHSLKVPGARSKNGLVKEEVINKIQSQVFKQTMEAAGHICDEFDPENDDIAAIGRKAKGYDAFISWHNNSFDGEGQPGTEVFVTTYASAAQEAIAKKVCDAICNELGTKNRGVKKVNFTVINEADKLIDGPVMLIESFFVTNITDPKVAEDMAKRAAMAASKAIIGSL